MSHYRTRGTRDGAERPPLDEGALERIALSYVGRYATTRAKLGAYLQRKLAERGWAGGGAAPVDAVVARLAALGYVDDAAFAGARTRSLLRRGYGGRRIGGALRQAGVGEEEARAAAEAAGEGAAEAAAIAFARRRRLGPFGPPASDPAARRRAFAAMMRAGHDPVTARRVLGAAAIDELESEAEPPISG